MAYGLPAHGDSAASGWDQKFIDSIVAVKATADAAAGLTAGGMAGPVVQGLFQRTTPTPFSGTAAIVPYAVDPNVAGRVWAQEQLFAELGYTDDHGATYTAKAPAIPGAGALPLLQVLFAGGYLWCLVGSQADQSGQLWRSPQPDSSGNGISWTKMFDLAAPYGALVAGDHATLRPQCLAVNGANVYLVEYSNATPITGGPSLFYSSDSGATWTKPKTWASGKHAHAVKVIGGVPWVMIGDGGPFADSGLWAATSAGATVWSMVSLRGEANGGNTLYGLNFQTITVGAQPQIVIEYDGALNYGPLIFPSQDRIIRPLLPTFQMPAAYYGTMRCLTLTSEGNLMWVQTSEAGALGTIESIWISKSPFTSAVLLDTFAPSSMFFGDPIEDGNYVWFGTMRCRKEKFVGQ